MQTKIHYIVPTCAPKIMKEKLLPSLKEFEPVSDLVSFGFVFQKYSKEEIREVLDECKKYNLDCRYTEREYEFEQNYTPIVLMRDDAAMLNPTAEIYGCIDDDCIYSKDYPYAVADVVKAVIEYFDTYPKCGSIMVVAREPQGRILPNVYNQKVSTCIGLYVKNIYPNGHIVPENLVSLKGHLEDLLLEKQRIADGYFSAICYAKCGTHGEGPEETRGHNVYGWINAKYLEGTVGYYIFDTLHLIEFNYAPLRKNKTLPAEFLIKKRN